MRSAAGSLRRIAGFVVVIMLLATSVVALDVGPAGAAALQDGCEVAGDTGGSGFDPCDCIEVDAAGEGIDPCFDPCDEVVSSGKGVDPCVDPCEVSSAGIDPCAATSTPTPDPCAPTKGDDTPCEPDPCGDVVASGGEVDPCATATPSPTPDPCAPSKGDADPCATETPTTTPVPPDSCDVPTEDAAALGVLDCVTPEATETATEEPAIEEPVTEGETATAEPDAAATATASPTLRETVTSLPNTGLGASPGPDRQPASTLPLLAAMALMALAVVGTLTRRRLTR